MPQRWVDEINVELDQRQQEMQQEEQEGEEAEATSSGALRPVVEQ